MIWANLLHLSYNMWEDVVPEHLRDDDMTLTTCQQAREWAHGYRSRLTFDQDLWDELLKQMAGAGMNMVIIDLGDGVRYESRPEIAVTNAWSTRKLKEELAKIRALGLEPIPKLNFATTHDAWLKEYSRMVSTEPYYAVCRDLIAEVSALFDRPRFFHLGMDEETAEHQVRHEYAVIRQHDLWWRDLYFYLAEVEKQNIRPWVWSDYAWHNPDTFFRKMPKSVLQSNWYYWWSGEDPDALPEPKRTCMKLYEKLEEHGYDQVPTGSNHTVDDNFAATVEYCRRITAPARLLGFMTAPWRPTLMPCRQQHLNAIDQVGQMIRAGK